MLRKSAQTQATYLSTYRRFADWLIQRTGHPDPPPGTLTADVVAAYVSELEARKAAATVKKERAALNRLAKYLHTLGAIDATEILMIEGSQSAHPAPQTRRARCGHLETRQGRRPRPAASRPPRTHLQSCRASRSGADPPARRDGAALRGSTGADDQFDRSKASGWAHPWLTVYGKGAKTRELPIPPEVAEALLAWLEQRERILSGPRGPVPPARSPAHRRELSRRRPPASTSTAAMIDDGRLSPHALRDIVRPVMLAAGVPPGSHIHTSCGTPTGHCSWPAPTRGSSSCRS